MADFVAELKQKPVLSQTSSSLRQKDDFVAEIKQRPFLSHTSSSLRQKDDFVAEIKSRSHNQTDLTQNVSRCNSSDESDLYLQKILTDRQFSREGITRLLESSILTLIETVLNGKPVSRIEGSICVTLYSDESPIVVNLSKPFPRFHKNSSLADHALDTSLNIKIKDRDVATPCTPLTPREKPQSSPCFDFSRDSCHSPAGSDSSLQMSLGYHSDRDSCISSPPHDSRRSSPAYNNNIPSPPHNGQVYSLPHDVKANSPSPNPRVDIISESRIQSPEDNQDTCDHGDSILERDCISREKINCDIPSQIPKDTTNDDHQNVEKPQTTYNDYFCSGFDGKNTVCIQAVSHSRSLCPNKQDADSCGSSEDGIEEMDDDDIEAEHDLVIDEHPLADTEATTAADVSDAETVNADNEDMESSHTDFSEGCPEQSLRHDSEVHDSLADDEVDSPTNPDIIDCDADVYLPGNSELTSDVLSVIPHPEGFVSKHPGGFKCKQCLYILPDILAVSRHVQNVHELHCCTYCCRTFTYKNDLKRHVRHHRGQAPFKCVQCLQSFITKEDLKDHMISHDVNKPYRCSVCKKGYTDRVRVKNHMARKHGSLIIHVCPQCGESYDGEESFTTHKRSHPELAQFSCKTCSFIGSNNLMTVKHSLLHNHKLFSCKPCNAYFADPFHYTNHVKKHKKHPSFTQYVCCFCDLAISSYDQYVRHEYSHAQGKVHVCKICTKQFRSKSSLHDHTLTHQEMATAEQKHTENVEKTQSNSPYWQSSGVNENYFFQPDNYSLRNVSEITRRTYEADTQIVLPAMQESEDDECFGQLLDLSMKKSPNQTLFKDHSRDDQSQNGNCSASVRATGQPVHNFPRNGVVITDPVNLSQECGIREHDIVSGLSPTVERSNGSFPNSLLTFGHTKNLTNSVSFDRHQSQNDPERVIRTKINMRHISSSKSDLLNRSRSEKMDVPASASDRRMCQRAILTNPRDRALMRLNPYYREKMADLAAKFMVARGTNIIGNRTPLKAMFPVGDEQKAIKTREQDVDKTKRPFLEMSSDSQSIRTEGDAVKESGRNLANMAFMDNVEVTGENSNPGMALGRHLPTVVKSEPMMVQPELPNSPLDCRFQRGSDDEMSFDNTAVLNGHIHECEICREQFGSFNDLENHSVEMHKRYLCEHCRKSFTARPNRDRHVRYHTGERPYRCDLCDLAFFRGDDLKYHRTTRHPTAQPFICTRCSASFTWGRDLERHIRHSKCKV